MLKLLATLFRARAADTAEMLADTQALSLLRQQIRDATAELRVGKRALALATVQHEAEGKQSLEMAARIADLETRAVAAIAGAREDLAAEAAQAIAKLEADRLAIEQARHVAAKDIADLQASLNRAAFRLAELERGRRIAAAAETIARLRARATGYSGALADAERTLAQLRAKQVEAADVDATLATLDAESSPEAIACRLESEGFGPRRRASAEAVLARLRLKAQSSGTLPPSPTQAQIPPLLPRLAAGGGDQP